MVWSSSGTLPKTRLSSALPSESFRFWHSDAHVKFNLIRTWDFAGSESSSLLSQQVGLVWAGSEIVSLSFSGVLNVIDIRLPQPSRSLYGREKPPLVLL